MSEFSRNDWYAPGSDEAIARGCRCAVMDNYHGRGYMGVAGIYVRSGDCPLHGETVRELHSENEKREEVDK